MSLSRRGALALGLFALGDRLLDPVCGTETDARPDGRPHHFTLHPDGFRLDGRPMQIRSGEMHPARIPRAEWAARIAMAKAMGLNTISIYLMWNNLEHPSGVFDFQTDRRDIAAFLRLCQDAGLWVFLRPGPYICGEWDLGGLPASLLYGEDIALRTRDPRFLAACERYIAAVAPVVKPYLAAQGGPILMTQVENEYASFGGDLAYMAWVREAWLRAGITGPFSIADGLPQLTQKRTVLPGCAIGLDGEDSITGLKAIDSTDPGWISEAYPGWLTHWGEKSMAKVDFTGDLRTLLKNDLSFNLYVVHGGTNFGFTAGANAGHDGSRFQPVITSYDYDAPIDEAGRPTPKYHAFRALMLETVRAVPPVPPAPPMTRFSPVIATRAGALRRAEGRRVTSENPLSLERALHQGQGMGLYRVNVPAGVAGALRLPPVHDHARVFLDTADLGTISRMSVKSAEIVIGASDADRTLEILVDTFGHIGYGPALGDRKGLEGPAFIGNTPLKNWTIIGLPLDEAHVAKLSALEPSPDPNGYLFKATVDRDKDGGVYIDMSGWKKGYLWVNGHALGRFWNAGPQYRLFCPASFLHRTGNEILILDYHQEHPACLSGHSTMTEA